MVQGVEPLVQRVDVEQAVHGEEVGAVEPEHRKGHEGDGPAGAEFGDRLGCVEPEQDRFEGCGDESAAHHTPEDVVACLVVEQEAGAALGEPAALVLEVGALRAPDVEPPVLPTDHEGHQERVAGPQHPNVVDRETREPVEVGCGEPPGQPGDADPEKRLGPKAMELSMEIFILVQLTCLQYQHIRIT